MQKIENNKLNTLTILMSNPLTECILKNELEIGFAIPLSSEPLGPWVR